MTTDTAPTTITRTALLEYLLVSGACATAQLWVIDRPHLTPQQVWEQCPRADWLLWLAGEAVVDAAHISAALATLDLKDERPARMPWVTVACKIENDAMEEYDKHTGGHSVYKSIHEQFLNNAANDVRTVLPWGLIETAMLEHAAEDSQAAHITAMYDYNNS